MFPDYEIKFEVGTVDMNYLEGYTNNIYGKRIVVSADTLERRLDDAFKNSIGWESAKYDPPEDMINFPYSLFIPTAIVSVTNPETKETFDCHYRFMTIWDLDYDDKNEKKQHETIEDFYNDFVGSLEDMFSETTTVIVWFTGNKGFRVVVLDDASSMNLQRNRIIEWMD